jgi:hypothetical protein
MATTATRTPVDPAREVLSQPPERAPVDCFAVDLALREGLAREGGAGAEPAADEAGAVAGSVEAREHGALPC